MLIDDYSPESLVATLSNAFLEAEISDENEVYIKDGLDFPMWLAVLEDGGLLRISTYIAFKDETDELAALRLANRINSKYAPNALSVDEGRLWCYYFELLNGSIEAKKLVNILRRCASAFIAGVRSEDHEDLIS